MFGLLLNGTLIVVFFSVSVGCIRLFHRLMFTWFGEIANRPAVAWLVAGASVFMGYLFVKLTVELTFRFGPDEWRIPKN